MPKPGILKIKKQIINLNFHSLDLKCVFRLSILVMLLILIVSSYAVGPDCDEIDMNEYGKAALRYYTSMGQDVSYLNIDIYGEVITIQRYYGVVFDIFAAYLNKIFNQNDEFILRHILNAILAGLALLFTGLIAKTISKDWLTGIIAIWLLFLSPRFFGHAISNTKDLPFAAFYTMGIYFLLRLLVEIPKINPKTALGIIASIGLAMNIRIGGLLLIPYLFLFVGISSFTLSKKGILPKLNIVEFRKVFIYLLFLSVTGYILGVVFWPFLMSDPINNTIASLKVNSNHPLHVPILFDGKLINTKHVPWYYISKYVIISTPLVILCGFFWFPFARIRNLNRINISILFFAIFFPLIYVIMKNSTLYTGWRHLLFIYPSFIAISAIGLKSLIEKNRRVVTGIIVSLLIYPTFWMMKNHPYQTTYFNILVKGTNGAYQKYEQDYYQLGSIEAWKWLENELVRGNQTIVYTNNPRPLYKLSEGWQEDVTILKGGFKGLASNVWDYAILSTQYLSPAMIQMSFPPKGTIKTVEVDDVPISCVVQRTNTYDLIGINHLKNNRNDSALIYLNKAIEYNPNNVGIWQQLAYVNFLDSNYTSALNYALEFEKAYYWDIKPKTLIGRSYLALKQYDNARIYFQELVDIVPNNLMFNYSLGLSYAGLGDTENAIKYFTKCIDLDPNFQSGHLELQKIYDESPNG
mgnify:CR=1 FL=1